MIIFRAVNIYPGQIDQVLSNISDASCEYQVHLDRKEDGKDHMFIRVECEEGLERSRRPELAQIIAKEIKNKIMVSAEVEMLDYGSLPRSERKAKRFFDNRLD
jgi:phenylacetate-CoA ligase